MGLSVLWLCNVPLPRIAENLGLQQNYLGGWLEGMANEIKKISGLELTVVFPVSITENMISGSIDGISYFGVPSNPHICDRHTEANFKTILSTKDPDILHIHGSEYPHSPDLHMHLSHQ
jgi:hypothetical protein